MSNRKQSSWAVLCQWTHCSDPLSLWVCFREHHHDQTPHGDGAPSLWCHHSTFCSCFSQAADTTTKVFLHPEHCSNRIVVSSSNSKLLYSAVTLDKSSCRLNKSECNTQDPCLRYKDNLTEQNFYSRWQLNDTMKERNTAMMRATQCWCRSVAERKVVMMVM